MDVVEGGSIDEVLACRVFAVAGVSADVRKFGTRVWRWLRHRGSVAYGLNPALGELDGERVYASAADLPSGVEVLVTVVPPAATLEVVKAARDHGIGLVWMQEGSESPEAIAWAREAGMGVVYGHCIMVEGGGGHHFGEPGFESGGGDSGPGRPGSGRAMGGLVGRWRG